MSVEPSESMSEVWTRWQGHVINGVFPLGRYLGCSDHSGVFLTKSAAREPFGSRGQARSHQSSPGGITTTAMEEGWRPRSSSLASSVGVGRVPAGRVALSVRRHGVRRPDSCAAVATSRPDGRRSARNVVADPGGTGVPARPKPGAGPVEAGKHPGGWRSVEAGKRHDPSRQRRHAEHQHAHRVRSSGSPARKQFHCRRHLGARRHPVRSAHSPSAFWLGRAQGSRRAAGRFLPGIP